MTTSRFLRNDAFVRHILATDTGIAGSGEAWNN